MDKAIAVLLFVFIGGAIAISLPRFSKSHDIYVISHPNFTVEESDISMIFRGEKRAISGVKLKIVENRSVLDAFLSRLGLDKTAYEALWQAQAPSQSPDDLISMDSDVEVIEFVKKNINAVGFVSKPEAGVKLVKKLE